MHRWLPAGVAAEHPGRSDGWRGPDVEPSDEAPEPASAAVDDPCRSEPCGNEPSGDEPCGNEPCGDDPRVRRTRRAVLEAVRQLLLTEGWQGVTPMAVAERAGVGRSTLYRHWPGADELLRDALVEQTCIAPAPATGSLRDDLVAQLGALADQLGDPCFRRVVLTVLERADADAGFDRLRADLSRHGSEVFGALLEAARSDGRLAARMSVPDATSLLVGPVLYRCLVQGEPPTPELLARIVDDFLQAQNG